MNTAFRIHEAALEEASKAAAWYEHECPGLGYEFLDAVETAFDFIEDDYLPLLPMPNKTNLKNVRRLILKKFPFDIVVLEHHQEKIILAVAHQARKPGYWRDRIQP